MPSDNEYNRPEKPAADGDYPKKYYNLKVTDWGSPICPRCGRTLYQRKEMQGFNTWECSTSECPLIEGEFMAEKWLIVGGIRQKVKDNKLEHIHYTAEPISFLNS